ncbi:MAG TPA: DUF4190 domain-containing protein [Bacteroidales bacterium]
MGKEIIKYKFCLTGLIFILFATSCQRSQFATTSRIYNKGRVTYTNSYHYEGRKSSKGKSYKNQLKCADRPATAVSDIKTDLKPEITRIETVSQIRAENLIASTTIEPILTVVNENKVSSFNKPASSDNNLQLLKSGFSYPDTSIKNNEPKTEKKEIQSADTRKIEKFGLTGFILSILGLFPIVGLPLAILGLIFGIKSLRKIHRNSTLYKGKGFAIASIIFGVLGIIVSLVLIGMFISLSIWSHSGA